MPGAEVLVSEVKEVSKGTSKRGPWSFHLMIDNDQEGYGILAPRDQELLDKATAAVGKRVKINFENTERGKALLDLEEVAGGSNGDAPASVSTYTEGEASKRRGIACSIAVQEAKGYAELEFKMLNPQREWTPALVEESIDRWLEHLFIWQLRKLDAIEDRDIPFLPEYAG